MKILITAPYNIASLKELELNFDEVIYEPWKKRGKPFSDIELLEMLKKHNIDGLITELDDVSKTVIDGYENLKFIGVCRANPVNVDVNAAEMKNIKLFTTPGRNAQAVAELFIGNLISFMRNTVDSVNYTKSGQWNGTGDRPYIKFRGNELAGKKVGFVGFGAVSQRIANILRHFPCDISYYDPFIKNAESIFRASTLEELFEENDIVTIHLPAIKETESMINETLLKKLKSNAIFVNTARASVVDNDALYNILKEKSVRGAILDVFVNEPPSQKDMNIISLDNVLATPHIAGASYEVESHHSTIMNEKIINWLKNK